MNADTRPARDGEEAKEPRERKPREDKKERAPRKDRSHSGEPREREEEVKGMTMEEYMAAKSSKQAGVQLRAEARKAETVNAKNIERVEGQTKQKKTTVHIEKKEVFVGSAVNSEARDMLAFQAPKETEEERPAGRGGRGGQRGGPRGGDRGGDRGGRGGNRGRQQKMMVNEASFPTL